MTPLDTEEDAGSQDDGQHAQARMNLATGTADQKQLIQEVVGMLAPLA
jgi:hypothetical protein